MTEESDERQGPPTGWLVAGAVIGLVAATVSLLDRPAVDDPGGWVARIDDDVIDRERFDRELARIEAAGVELGRDDAAEVLDGLIAEVLLFRRGVALGLAESDRTVRDAVVQSMVASVTAEADAADPDDGTLERFLSENSDRYTYASALTVRAWTADEESAARRQLEAIADGSGETAADVAPVAGLPDGPAPLERLRMFLGPAIAAAAADMPIGDVQVFTRQGRWYVVQVAARESSAVAELEAVRSQVLLDYRRQLASERLSEYVEDLKRRADIVVALP